MIESYQLRFRRDFRLCGVNSFPASPPNSIGRASGSRLAGLNRVKCARKHRFTLEIGLVRMTLGVLGRGVSSVGEWHVGDRRGLGILGANLFLHQFAWGCAGGPKSQVLTSKRRVRRCSCLIVAT